MKRICGTCRYYDINKINRRQCKVCVADHKETNRKKWMPKG